MPTAYFARGDGLDPALRTSDPNVQKIFRAMQRYGLIVADNGSDMFITGTFDTRWDNDILNPAFSLLTASDFDVIQLGWKAAGGAPALGSVSANPSQVVGGNPSTGTVTLTASAPANGTTVTLSSASGSASVPPSVTVAQGASSATFAITTSAVATQTLITLSASYGGVTETTTLTVNPAVAPPPALATLTLNPANVVGGTSVTGTITLTAPAPSRGATVKLGSSKATLASAPATVVVAAGTTSKNFTITTTRPPRNSAVTISASYAGVTKTAVETITRR